MVAAPVPVQDLIADVPVARTVTVADLADFMDELAAYQAHYAPYFRPDQRGWAEFYLRGLLTADVPRKNIEALAGAGQVGGGVHWRRWPTGSCWSSTRRTPARSSPRRRTSSAAAHWRP